MYQTSYSSFREKAVDALGKGFIMVLFTAVLCITFVIAPYL